jgi:shikimate dehydrogenase
MPLKSVMAGLVDDLTPTARRLGAVNSIRLTDGIAMGDSTDGAGLLDALRAEIGFEPCGRRFVVLGAGGAARAVVVALSDAGAADIAVVNRDADRARVAAALAGDAARVGVAADIADGDVVINATSVGMAGTEAAGAMPIDPAALRPGMLVVDLVYHPLRTPLLEAAEASGADTVGGVGMLVHQAARQFTWWTGLDAPLAAMQSAAEAAIGDR